MNYKDYIINGKLILPEGFNSALYCTGNNLTELILPEGFNSNLHCSGNNLTELVLPEGFNSFLDCSRNNLTELILPKGFNGNLDCSNNNLTELILPKGFVFNFFSVLDEYPDNFVNCDSNVKVYTYEEWTALERDRKINEILKD